MTSNRETDYVHSNERGNAPKARMEGGDETDDIAINDPDTRAREMRKIKSDQKKAEKFVLVEDQIVKPE